MNDTSGPGAMRILLELLHEQAGITVDEGDRGATFFELGLDSLFLTQFSVSAGNRFGRTLTFRQLTTEFNTLHKLARWLGEPAEGQAPTAGALPKSPRKAANVPDVSSSGASNLQLRNVARLPLPDLDPLIQLFMGQLDVIQQQLDAINGMMTVDSAASTGQKEARAEVPTALSPAPEDAGHPSERVLAGQHAESESNGSTQGMPTLRSLSLHSAVLDAAHPPVPNARLGRDPAGNPAWFIPKPDSPGKYVKLD